MSSQAVIDFLTKQIFIERNVVTYRSLSRELRLHVNTAKNELATYHDTAPYRSQTSHATYLICGEIDSPYAEDVPMDYEEGKDVLGDYEDDGDNVPQMKLLLVNEDGLEAAKRQFTRINTIHIYSLAPSPLRDAGYICTPTEHVRAADRGKDATEMVKIVGKVVSSNIKIVHTAPKPAKSTRQPVAGPSRLKPADKEKEASVELPSKETTKAADKAKDKVKPSGKLNFFNTKPKEKKIEASVDTSKGKEKEVDKSKEEQKEEVAEKPKEKEKLKKTVKEEAKSSKVQQSKTVEPKKRGTKRKSVLGLSDSEEERRPSKAPSRHVSPLPPPKEKEAVRVKGRAVVSDDEAEDEVAYTSRKSRKDRPSAALDPDNDDVLALMDIDDDEVTRVTREKRVQVEADRKEEKVDDEVEEKPIVGDDEDVEMEDAVPKAKPKKRAPKKVVPVGRNGLKKTRVVKSRSTIDDKGYMVFEDYSDYESVDEEPEPARGKGKAKEREQESDDDSTTAAAKAKSITKGAPKAPTKPAKAPTKGANGGNKGGQKQLTGFFMAKPKK